MDNNLNDKKAEIFKALANPVRLDVIDQLLEGEKCVIIPKIKMKIASIKRKFFY